MNKFHDLYNFLEFAKNNRKYPTSTANNLKSSLKIFEQVLNEDELNSLNLIEDSIEEIFVNVVNNNKQKSIESLNTYKARFLKVLNDYKRYGENPSKIKSWETKPRNFTPLLNRKDKQDKKQDKPLSSLSTLVNTPVENNSHRLEICLNSSKKATLIIPKDIDKKDVEIIKNILGSFV